MIESDSTLNQAVPPSPDVEKSAGNNSRERVGHEPSTESDQTANPASNDAKAQQRQMTGFSWALVCIGMFSVNLLYGLDNTIAAVIQDPVVETFNSVDQLGWLGVGFTLGATALSPSLGKAYAIFDTKWLFIGCVAMFAAGSALCGAAPSMNAMIVGRVWAGAGGTGMYLGNLNLITILTTPKEQPMYVGMIGLVYGTGAILGPIVGGSLSDSDATWRWSFYLNLVIFGVVAPIYIFVLPSLPRQNETTFIQKLKTLDWLGTVLITGIYVPFVLALTFGGSIWPWNSGRIIALFVVFGVCLIAFCFTQYYTILTTVEYRIFPCEFVGDKSLVLLYICMACGGASLFVAIYYIPLYFQYVHGDNGTEAAVRLLPFVCFYIAAILLCGYLMPKTGYYILWYLVSGIFTTIGASLMYTTRVDTPTANIYGYSVIFGLGMVTTQAAYAVGPTLVAPHQVVEVINFMNISQSQSQLLGLTIASAIFQQLTFKGLKEVLSGSGFSDADIRAAIAGAKSHVLQDAAPELRARAIEVIVNSIDDAYVMVIAAGGLYIVCSLFLKREK